MSIDPALDRRLSIPVIGSPLFIISGPEMVMEGLRQLDSVAYIRFASVYRDFTEARDFEEFASTVREVGGS